MAQYATRQEVEQVNAADLAAIKAPIITLPELIPPIGVGELRELAGWFFA